jgi:hypothetical protein
LWSVDLHGPYEFMALCPSIIADYHIIVLVVAGLCHSCGAAAFKVKIHSCGGGEDARSVLALLWYCRLQPGFHFVVTWSQCHRGCPPVHASMWYRRSLPACSLVHLYSLFCDGLLPAHSGREYSWLCSVGTVLALLAFGHGPLTEISSLF